MPPKQTRSFSRTLSNNSAASTASSASSSKRKLKQNKLDFSLHSTSTSTRPFGSRPLSSTPSFGLPTVAAARPPSSSPQPPPPPPLPLPLALDKGKQKQQDPSDSTVQVADFAQGEDATDLWSERLAPRSADELAVHPKKVAQVKGWLVEAFSPQPALARHRKVLALTGPAGAGKSATIRALAAATELDFDLLEWQNDQPAFDPSNPGPSFVERFTDFLSKGAKFPTLDFHSSDNEDASSSSLTLDSGSHTRRNRVILLEDLPNLHHLPTKQLFQACIEQHVQQSSQLTSRGFPNVPIVLIITESTPREDEDRWAADSSANTWRERIASIMDTRSALGDKIRNHPAYTEIRFNPVAPTIILKGLKRAMERASRSSSNRARSRALVELLQAVADDSGGDLRAAVNCLQFVGAQGQQLEAAIRHKGANRAADASKTMRKLLPLVSGRESSLALFHALGRVLYNKRQGDLGDEGAPVKRGFQDDEDSDNDEDDSERTALRQRLKSAMQSIIQPSSTDGSASHLPEHMASLERRPSRVAVDQLWADLPVDSSVFQLYLHQNLPQFCTEIEQCESILEGVSSADALTPLHEQYRHSSLLAYYSFLITTRATLLHLPSPVPRSGQKLGKATWWDVQKKLRVTLQNVDELKASQQGGAGRIERDEAGAGRFKRTKFSQPSLDALERTDAGLGDEMASTLQRGNAVTLVTEILPLLAKIQPPGGKRDGRAYELSRMRFEYAGVADMASRTLGEHETAIDADDDDNDEDAQNDRNGRERTKASNAGDRKAGSDNEQTEHLFLSDDDIDEF